ncbi:MAG: hypothetical protein ACJ735_02335 [Actinomycetes bacterium]
MTATQHRATVDMGSLLAGVPQTGVGSAIDVFAEADAERQRGRQLALIRAAAPTFRHWFAGTGTPDAVMTYDLISLPYPTKFGLFRAAVTPAPYLTITNRMLVIRWRDGDGTTKTLLFEPSDHELGENTPYFAALASKLPAPARSITVSTHGTVLTQLAAAGVAPEDVDYIVFDHLHTQDVRRLIGTTVPQQDIAPEAPAVPWLPNARMIVQRSELEAMAALHPLQRPWYQPETYADLRPEGLLTIDGDVLLGPGVAILATPGHTIGNQSLVLNTSTGIWASSENVIATECLTPEVSRIPGLSRWAHRWGQELIINANTIESTAEQYNSCVKEKLVVDRSATDARFLQFFPSSELTRSRLSPGAAPTFTHGGIHHRKG